MNMDCRPRADAFGFASGGHYQPWSAAVSTAPLPRASFESLALLVGRSAPGDEELIGLLLASAFPVKDHGCEALRPLWTEEAMHRAYGFMRLVDARQRDGRSTRGNPVTAGVEDYAARDLAMRFCELRSVGERTIVPCAEVLRDVVTDLGTLFGYPANIVLTTNMDRVSLPAYKRRALVLAACELFCNALLHAFPGREAGMVEAGLTVHHGRSACLRVADNGTGFNDMAPNLACGMAASLAGLLEADLAYERTDGWTVAEIVFPVSGA